mgnify:FL=1
MAYGTLNAGAITPGSGNTLTVSEAVTFSGAVNLGTPSAGVVTNLSGVLPVEVTGGSGLTTLASNPTVTLGANTTITDGSLNASQSGSYTMFYSTQNAGAVSGGATFTFDIWNGHAGPFHAMLMFHISAPETGLNYATGRTGFNHNGSALYQYGLDENHGAHLSAPTFAFSGSGASAKCTVTFTSAVALSAGQAQWSATLVSNVKLLAP